MTNKEILKRAIQKAIEGGYPVTNVDGLMVVDGGIDKFLFSLIQMRRFAKVLWGNHEVKRPIYVDIPIGDTSIAPTVKTQPNWQYHLQQMVIAEDPIKYLGKNI